MSTLTNILANATTIILENTEAIQIVAIMSDEKYVLGQGEETGETYQISFDEIDLETTMFYRSGLMNNNEYTPENMELCDKAKELFYKLLSKNPRNVLKALKFLESIEN